MRVASCQGLIKYSKRRISRCKKVNKKSWNVNVGEVIISRLIKTKNNCKDLIEYLDDTITALVLILPSKDLLQTITKV